MLLAAVDTEKYSANVAGQNVLHGAVRSLCKVIELLKEAELSAHMDALVPLLAECMKNPNAMIRKDVVSCFVAISTVIGEKLEPYLSTLNMSQSKLIKIYISRALQPNTGGILSPRSPT